MVRLAREIGLVKLGTIAVDRTKVKANASRHKSKSYGHMPTVESQLKAQRKARFRQAQRADEAKGNEPKLNSPRRSPGESSA